MAGGQIDGATLGLSPQDGDTQFLQRFGLQTHDAYDQVGAMKFGLEYQNPTAAGTVTAAEQPTHRTIFVDKSLESQYLLMVAQTRRRWHECGRDHPLVERCIIATKPVLHHAQSPITSARRSPISKPIWRRDGYQWVAHRIADGQQMATYLVKNSAGGALPAIPVLVDPPITHKHPRTHQPCRGTLLPTPLAMNCN